MVYVEHKDIAEFKKVSFAQFKKDCIKCGIEIESKELLKYYNMIKLPHRATKKSAGYDFYTPIPFTCNGEWKVIPTGIKCKMDNCWVLTMMPKSGLGFKYRTRFANTIGVVDGDYYNNRSDEGDIKIEINSEVEHSFETGDKFVQGIFLLYGTAKNDEPVSEERVGGFGSTGEK